jgi:Spy/CpxP family protein refolding chaperone
MSTRTLLKRAIAATTVATGIAALGVTAAHAAGMNYVYWEPTYMHCKWKQWTVLNEEGTTLLRDCTESNGQWYFTTLE